MKVAGDHGERHPALIALLDKQHFEHERQAGDLLSGGRDHQAALSLTPQAADDRVGTAYMPASFVLRAVACRWPSPADVT